MTGKNYTRGNSQAGRKLLQGFAQIAIAQDRKLPTRKRGRDLCKGFQ